MQFRCVSAVILGLTAGLFSGVLQAQEAADPAKQKCQIAEVNPVTGHAICIKPVGAPVEQPPEQDIAADCEPGDASQEDWSWSSKCRPARGE